MNSITKILSSIDQPWNECNPAEASVNLLRRSLLREVAKSIHAERSKTMAKGDTQGTNDLRDFEKKLETLTTADLTNLEFKKIGIDHSGVNLLNQNLPKALVAQIGEQKINRFDRKWERQLLTDAVHALWQVWHFDAWIKVFRAEHFHKTFAKKLWPQAIVLFVEGYPNVNLGLNEKSRNESLWKGRWLICSKMKGDEISLQWDEEDGIDQSIENPQWSKLELPRDALGSS